MKKLFLSCFAILVIFSLFAVYLQGAVIDINSFSTLLGANSPGQGGNTHRLIVNLASGGTRLVVGTGAGNQQNFSIDFNGYTLDFSSANANATTPGGAYYFAGTALPPTSMPPPSGNTGNGYIEWFSSAATGTMNFTNNVSLSSGGAAFFNGGYTHISNLNVNFTNNISSRAGGAIYLAGTIITQGSNTGIPGYLDFDDNNILTFTGNRAQSPTLNVYGGAVYLDRGTTFNSNAVTTFQNNIASATAAGISAYGGAIYVSSAAVANFTNNTTFTGNTAFASVMPSYGGAIYNAGALNLTPVLGTSITFANNSASFGRDVWNTASATMTISGAGHVYFGSGVEGYGRINKTGTGNVYFQATSYNKIDSTMTISAGGMYLSTSIYVQTLNLANNTTLGIDVVFSDPLNNPTPITPGTSFIWAPTMSVGTNVMLDLNVIGFEFAGSSVAVMFTNSDMTSSLFANANSIQGAKYLYDFVWVNDNQFGYNWTGWLIWQYPPYPWNTFVLRWEGVAVEDYPPSDVIVLEEDIIARDDVEEIFRDDNPFGSPVYFSSVTVLGSGKTIDSNNLYEKKFLLNNGQEAIFSSVTLRNFASAQYGGAMLLGPGGKVSFVDEVNFINNKAARGGAIAITDSSTASFNNRTVFSGNVSYDNGGTSTNTAMGGAVYVSSSVITVTGTVDFTQNIASAAAVGAYGGAIFIGSNSVLNVNGGGAINFTNNAARGAESYGGAIYNSGEINITAGNASFVNNNSNGTIGAGGAIYNAAGSTISFINANVSFINNVAMSSGGAIYNAGTFNIEDSTLTFSGNQANGQANDFYQTAEGIMNIMGSADVNMDGVVQGEGLINKSATGLLSLNRNHSLYTGYFNQTAGTTTVTSAGRMFAGTNTISNSVLNITASDIYYTVNLSTAGMLRHWDENITSSTTVNGNLIRFTANGATAYFGLAPEAAAPNIYAYYNLDGKIDNGQSNTVVFDNSYVIFSSTDFVGGSTYEFTNSIIDLVDPVGITTRTIEFTGVNATGSMLRFGIGFEEIGTSSFSLVSDKLISDAGSSGELDIFRTIRLYFGDEFEDLTLNYDYYTKVLYGGLTFQNNISTITIGTASNRRSYQLWVAEDLQGIYVNSDGSSTSLYISNLQEGYRQYLIDVDTYNISGIFTDTSQGTFLVFGNDDVDDDPSSWVISGVIVSTDTNINGTSSYLFTLSSATDFTLQYLTVTSATAITDPASPTRIEWGESGAVILQTNAQSTATIEGVYFTYNTAASSGGAIATYAGQMSISNALFMGNEANAGGAIYSVNEGLIINNSQFEDNIAVSSGGAIYNDAGGSLILGADAESVNFSNNSALSGGAIYNAGSVVLSASEGISINFIDNSALNAVYGHDIYQTSAGTITIDGGGDIVISGGIAGSGTINKTAGNLYLDGDNSGYAGTFNQSAGYTEVTGGYFTGISSITGGILELADGASVGAVTIGIYSGGLLDITTDGDLTFTGNISGNGNINKDLSATGTLTLTGDNSGFNGTFTQNAGTTIVNGGKYFTGISRINAGVLNINAATLVNGGTMGIYGGGQVYFETSAVLDALNMGSGLLGLEVDWNQGGKGLLTLFIETTTTTLTANSRLHVTTVTAAAVKVVGSSTSIMSADYLTNGQSVVFSTNNITGDSLYGMGYRFKWSQDADGWTGWLLTGALPWNTLVSYTINAVSGETIYLAENVTAGLFDTADRNAFATLPVTATNITLAGYNGQTYIIDSGGIQNLGLTLDGSSVTIRDLELRNFVRQAAGGAINNVNGQLTIINSNFVGNYADTSGGAIYNAAGSSVYVEANGGISEIFANNTANSSFGGAIYNAGLVVLNASEGSSITFVNNKALLAGNDIYNVGTINITGLGDIVISSGIAGTGSGTINKTAGNLYLGGNNSGYAGTFNQSAGYTEVTGAYFTGISSITGGVLELADGASLSIGELGIYNGALLEITTGGDLEFSGNITGDGEINKELSSTGMLSLSGDNSGFTGIYRQYAGMTLVSGDYFTGISSITAGVLELADGAVLSTGTIGIYESALLEITTYGDLEFSGNITGDGNINKELSSAGTLTLTGDNSGFTGVFNQYAGTTTVTADGIMFSGINTISDSVLNITSGSVYYSVNLSTNAILNHYGLNTVSTTTIESSTAQTIDNSKINFTGYGAAANFGLDSSVSDADIYAHYNLAEKIDNGQINTVAFDNAYVVFGSTDYSGASIYTFTDSIIDITSAGNSTRTITFDDITATNSKLRFGIGFEEIGTSSFSLVSDKLVSNGAGTGELGILDSIRLYFGDDLSLTTNYDYYTQVLSGGLTFRTDISTITMGSASSAYTYELWVATNNYQSIYVRVLGEGMTLYDANMAVGDRSYLIDVSLYNIDRAFTDTGWGEFLVRGNGDDAGNWVISGEIPGTGSSYLFTLSSATDFTLRNLTVTQASATRSDTSNSGSVILQTSALSTATIENVYFTYNTALSSGGAIATYAGEMTIDSATFAGNTANAGGAIFNGNEQITINNSQFNDNTAVYGGAIYNALSANMSVIASDARQFIFDGNIASSSGGAIYNAGLINFETAAGSSITFINNSAASGSDIYNTGTINITGAGDVVISSGIAGSGTINNLANIYLGGDNSGYAGLFNQTAGYTKVTGNYFTGTSSITAGVLELADGAVLSTGTIGIYDSGLLEITTLGNLTFDGNILGDGTINKEATNTGTLTLNGDNSSFSGMFNQYAGKTVVTGNYFTGISSIAAGEINFNGQAAISGGNIYLGNAGVMNINMDNALSMGTNLVSGTGVINKDNAANLNITGDNSSFRGMFNQYAGKTVVTGNYFTGASNITAGVLELADGAVLSTGTIGIYDSGLLEITTAGNLEFSGNITGNGNITKESSSTGVLTLTGNNSGFSGLYTQNAGTTAVTGTYFTGTSSITAGELALMANAQLLGGTIGIYDSADMNISGWNVTDFGLAVIEGNGYINKNSSTTFNIGSGLSSFEGTYNQNAGTSAVTQSYGGTMNATGGLLEFSSSAFVNSLNLSAGAILGVTVDFTSAYSANTTSVTVNTINIDAASKLYATDITAINKVVGSSAAVIFSGSNNGVAFSTSNILGGDQYGYRFMWDNNNVGWLVYGALPWNTFVGQYKNAVAGSTITLAQDIIALENVDDNAFGSLTGNNFTIDAAGHVINSSGLLGKGMMLSNKTLTIQNATFENFAKSVSSGSVMNISGNSQITIDNVKFVSNTANVGGAIQNGANSTINFGDVIFTSNSSTGEAGLGSGRSGGAILNYATGATINFSGLAKFEGNHTTYNGGAIYNYQGVINFGETSVSIFENNYSSHFGGAIENANPNAIINVMEGSLISFTGNRASRGGAIYNTPQAFVISSGVVSFVSNESYGTAGGGANPGGGGAIYNGGTIYLEESLFSVNRSSYNGGAIYNNAGGIIALGSATFSGNIAVKNNPTSAGGSGGAVYNTGIFTIENGTFDGNVAMSSGGAIYNAGSVILGASEGSSITFKNNTAIIGNDIYQTSAGTISIIGAGDVIISSGIAGYGLIEKSSGSLYLSGNSSNYAGLFNQSGGLTKVTGNYFTGVSSITAGVLELADGAVLSTGTIGIYDSGLLEITTAGNLEFSGNIIGNGNITKESSSTGLLTLTGDNSGFSGLYTQNAGTTAVTGKYFTGVSSITAGELALMANAQLLGGTIGIYDSADMNISGWNVTDFGLSEIIGDGYINKNSSTTFNIGSGLANFEGTYNQNAGTSAVTQNFGGTMNAAGGLLEFSSSAFVNNLNLSAGAILGVTVDFTSAYSANTTSVTVNTINIDAASKLLATDITAINKVVGSSAAVIFAGSTNGVAFSTSNILGGDQYGYRFMWDNNIGWLVYGALPWNTFVGQYQNATGGETISLGQNIYADEATGDDKAFGTPINADFTIDGAGFAINASGLIDKGMELISGSSITIRNVTFENFAASASGGVIENHGGNLIVEGGVNFKNNTALGSGGAIYNSGNVVIAAFEPQAAVIFNNNAAALYGGAIYNAGTMEFNVASGSSITFINNSASVSGNDIYNSGTINISGAGDVVISSGIAGNGTINNSANVYLGGDNSDYIGIFDQTAGYTKVTGSYFTGVSSIAAGMLEIAQGGEISTGTIGIYNSGLMEITTSDNLTFAGQFRGDGNITKGAGTNGLILTGDNSGFTGVYEQTSGITTVEATGKMFTGTNNISNSTLSVYGEALANDLGYNVNVGNNGETNYYSQNLGTTTLSGSNINFTGNNGQANFYNTGAGEYAYYIIGSSFTSLGGAGNSVNFSTSHVSFTQADYTGGGIAYNFYNSEIDITNIGLNTRTISFDTLNLTGSNKLSLGMIFYSSGTGYAMDTDKLEARTNSSGVFDSFFGMRVYAGDEFGNLTGTYNSQVLFGTMTFATSISSYVLTMGTHTYVINADSTNWQNINVEVTSLLTLYQANALEVNRGWVWNQAGSIYYIDQELGNTGKGEFEVSGGDENAASWVVSGKIENGSGYGSFFKLTDESNPTTFLLHNLTIQEALADGVSNPSDPNTDMGKGSVLYMVSGLAEATVENVIITSNTSYGDGGAVYYTSGSLTINDTIFSSNTSGGMGGAIYVSSGITMENVTFVGNKATGTVSGGGAVYNSGSVSIVGEALFSGNEASGNGGAIYNAGLINFETAAGSSITFINNSAASGSDIYNTGTINISGAGDVVISSGIAGSGTINNSANIYLGGDNSGYAGIFNQTEGYTKVTGSYFTGVSSIMAGVLELADGAVLSTGTIGIYDSGLLEITTTGNLEFSGNITGNGNITKETGSTGVLTLTGNNSGFSGLYTQNAGTTAVTGTYFTGTSSITAGELALMANAQLLGGTIGIYDSADMNISGWNVTDFGLAVIEGNGYINKNSSTTFNIGSGLSSFEGTYNQNAGTSAVTQSFGGTMNATGGLLEFSSSAFVNNLNLSAGGMLGVTVDFTSAYSANTTSVTVNTINIDAASKLLATDITAINKVVGSSAAVIFAGSTNGVAFSTSNILGGDQYGYRFMWDNNIGWLVYGAMPWNTFVGQYQNATGGETISLGQNIYADEATGDDKAFGTPINADFTIDGAGFAINASGLIDKGMELISGSSITIRDVTFENFAASSDGGVINNQSGVLRVEGGVNFTGNTASGNGGAIYNAGLINFETVAGSSITFINNSAVSGSDIYNTGTINISGAGDVVISSGIAGNGTINNSANVYLGGDNSDYIGIFNQTAGYTKVTGSYFTGISSIAAGVLELADGASLSTGTIGIYNSGLMEITTSGNLMFAGQFTGNGIINKEATNTGTLTLSGDNSSFSGMFNQYAGKTVVTGNYFTGASSITAGVLELADGAVLSTGTIGIYDSGLLDITTVGNLTFAGQFTGDGTIIKEAGTGELAISGDNSGFNGLYEQLGGTTTVSGNYFTGVSSIAAGEINFNGQAAIYSGNIYLGNAGVMNINMDNVLNIGTNLVSGTGVINKNNAANLNITGDNSSFRGMFNQYAGKTVVTGNYFTGASNITAGVLELADGAVLSTGTIGIYDSGLLEITTAGNLEFSGNIIGNGNITKESSSTGVLTLTGNNSGFSGLYTQNAGTTAVTGTYFTGTSSITAGELALMANAQLLGGTIGIYDSADMNISGWNVTDFGLAVIEGNGYINKNSSTTFNIGSGLSSFEGTYNQNFGTSAVTQSFGGTMNATGGLLEFSSSAFVNNLNLSAGAILGVTVDFTSAYSANTTSVTVNTINIDAASKLYATDITAINKVVGSSAAVIFAGSTNGVAFSTSNILGGDQYGYRFMWDNNVGWLVYGAMPWNTFVGQYQNATGGETISLGQNIYADEATGDDKAFGTPINADFTIDGAGFAINASGLIDKGMELISGSSITIRDVTFENFAASSDGGVINNQSGVLRVEGGVNFAGNTASGNGGAIYNAGLINFETVAGSSITFINNSAASGSDIYNTGTINISGAGDVVISSGIAGSGTINNSANIYLGGDNSGYAGIFNQTEGYTKVTGSYFTGISSIAAGVLELADGAVLSTGTIGIYDSGMLEITTVGNLTFAGEFTGNGTINKEASNTGSLTLTGDNSGFSGIFSQDSGTTTVTSGGKMFGGANVISNSYLNITGDDIYYTVNLSTNGVLTHYNNNALTAIEAGGNNNIRFVSSGASIIFDRDDSLIPDLAKYDLMGKIENGQSNSVIFNNGYIVLKSTDFAGATRYLFNDSTITLERNNPFISTTTYMFSNLGVTNTNMNVGIGFNNTPNAQSDILSVGMNVTGNNLDLGLVRVYDDKDAGLYVEHWVKVLDGAINFNAGGSENIATTAYEYEVSVGTNTQYVVLFAYRATDEYSLDRQNMMYDKRAFLFSFNDYTYKSGNSLHNMSSGVFTVAGYDGDATHSILSGELYHSTNTPTGRGTFFNIEVGTAVYFTLQDLTVTNAQANGYYANLSTPSLGRSDIDGSVLRLASALSTATISNVIFSNNEAYGSGGVIWQSAGEINITSATFDTNISTSGSGGAIYAEGGMLKVENGMFGNNTANLYGGAIFSGNEQLIINNSQFNGNTAASGGAIYNANSQITITNGEFNGNIAGVDGGAIYSYLGDIEFLGTSVSFTSNSAVTGSGGAIYAIDDMVFNNISATFIDNEALLGNGGAIFANDTIMSFQNVALTFVNNKAYNGGALYASNNSSVLFSGQGSFTGNTATSSGAAIYITGGSTVTLNAASGNITFSGNNINGLPNDVYMEGGSFLNLATNANNITLSGGILSSAADNNATVSKTGSGVLYLGGDSEVYGDFIVTGGKVTLLEDATFIGNNLIFNGAEFDMTADNIYDNFYVNTVNVTRFESDTNLVMDIFEDGTNDQIFANSAQVDGNLHIKAHFGIYNNKEYDLIMTSGSVVYGTFTSTMFDYVGTGKLTYELKYNDSSYWDGIVRLLVNGTNQANFSDLPNLTYNQGQVAGVWDPLSLVLADGTDLKSLMEDTAGLSVEAQKSVLSIASGYFLSNVIRSAALDSDNNEIYDRIKNHCEQERTNTAIWAQVTGEETRYGGDENSLGEYRDTISGGVMAGFDIYFGTESSLNKTMLGIYVSYKDHNIKQEANEATLNKIGLGLYGGYITKKWELKALLSGSRDEYETRRSIGLSGYLPGYADRQATADFNGLTIGADVEGALKYDIAKNVTFRPYAGIEAKNASYDGFNETGADGLNLQVDSGNYLRSAGRLGAGVGYDDKTWAGYINLEGKYLLTGSKYEIESVFEGTDMKFKSRGYKENGMLLGANIGGSVRIAEGLKFFMNANAYAADKFTNLYGNAGLRYNFCGIKHTKEKPEPVKVQEPVVDKREIISDDEKADKAIEEEMKRAQARREKPAPIPEVKPEPVKTPEPVLKKQETIITDEEKADKVIEEEMKRAQARREKPAIKKFNMKAATFVLGKAELTRQSREDIKALAEDIKKFKYTSIAIEGHTDSTGSAELNKRLSKERARVVFDELVKHGLDPDRMQYIGFGHTMPMDTNSTPQGRANNRRVEIFVE